LVIAYRNGTKFAMQFTKNTRDSTLKSRKKTVSQFYSTRRAIGLRSFAQSHAILNAT